MADDLALGYSVVVDLMRDCLYKHHHLYADLCSSILLVSLLNDNTYYCATIRPNKKIVLKDIMEGRLMRGDNLKPSAEGQNRCLLSMHMWLYQGCFDAR